MSWISVLKGQLILLCPLFGPGMFLPQSGRLPEDFDHQRVLTIDLYLCAAEFISASWEILNNKIYLRYDHVSVSLIC